MAEEELSGSDFDDDEDPDKIEVPGKFLLLLIVLVYFKCIFVLGGGKDLATAATIGENRDIKLKQEKDVKPDLKMGLLGPIGANNKMMAGMNMNIHPSHYDMMRQPSE